MLGTLTEMSRDQISRTVEGNHVNEGPPLCHCQKCFFEAVMETIRQQLHQGGMRMITTIDEKKGS